MSTYGEDSFNVHDAFPIYLFELERGPMYPLLNLTIVANNRDGVKQFIGGGDEKPNRLHKRIN
jgi:hypothetical protein